MSLIPKVNIGRKTKKNYFHIPSLTHGTSEIGFVMPSYSRNLINDASIKLGTRSLIRLSPLFVPTMGDLSVRHYHCFVPFNKIWTPFDAFMDKKPFAFPSGYSQIPTSVPSFVVGVLLRHLMQDNVGLFDPYDFDNLRSSLTMTIYHSSTIDGIPERMEDADFVRIMGFNNLNDGFTSSTFDKVFKNISLAIQEGSNLTYGGVPSIMFLENNIPVSFLGDLNPNDQTTLQLKGYNTRGICSSASHDRYVAFREFEANLSVPSFDACDFMESIQITGADGYDEYLYLCYNFNGAWKRLRSIFMGLGYCFNPFDSQYVTPLKLLAFYRCYWQKFGVNRDFNFQDTLCAQLTREISQSAGGAMYSLSDYNTLLQRFCKNELIHCTYTTPSDYFSSSVTNTQQSLLGDANYRNISVKSFFGDTRLVGALSPEPAIEARAQADKTYQAGNMPAYDNEYSASGLGVEMAMRLMRWINRRTVVGSAIYDGLRSLYGNIEVNDESSEGVVRIGEDSVNVEIGAIFNQADLSVQSGEPLGSFAGVGQGRTQKQQYYKFTAPTFGCVITLTAVVPQMGYFQGMLRENTDGVNDNFEMFDPTYDAVGWQSVRYNELASDRQFKTRVSNVQVGTALGLFGAQPRYTHMKCAFNRCVGDISLPHMQDSMLPYTLDRFFPQRKPLPANLPNSFRSATRGETNRIFQVTSATDDHVIWQIYFDIDMYAPMKSIADSYDTMQDDDTSTIEVSHE